MSTAQDYNTAEEATGIEAGIKAPLFEAMDKDSNKVVLKDLLEKGAVVMIFYRGYWCPVCNRHLGNLQDSLEMIYDKGASVLAISPEKPENMEKTAERTNARFTLVYDKDYKISDAYGVTFKPDNFKRFLYNAFTSADLKEAHSDASERLPIPATYIIGEDGIIKWRHFNADYKKRASIKEILSHL